MKRQTRAFPPSRTGRSPGVAVAFDQSSGAVVARVVDLEIGLAERVCRALYGFVVVKPYDEISVRQQEAADIAPAVGVSEACVLLEESVIEFELLTPVVEPLPVVAGELQQRYDDDVNAEPKTRVQQRYHDTIHGAPKRKRPQKTRTAGGGQ
jgi:hypothetical protein